MQTILGANGQIAEQLTRYLHDNVTEDIRLVSRTPVRLHSTDQLFPANLMAADATSDAVAGSDIAYLTVGLPIDSTLWEQQFPVMMANTIAACQKHGTKLVFFDNTYMYPRTSARQVEDTRFEPSGPKAAVRAHIADTLLDALRANIIDAVICRAPEFYGPGKNPDMDSRCQRRHGIDRQHPRCLWPNLALANRSRANHLRRDDRYPYLATASTTSSTRPSSPRDSPTSRSRATGRALHRSSTARASRRAGRAGRSAADCRSSRQGTR